MDYPSILGLFHNKPYKLLNMQEVFISFILSIMASVVAYYICKWLDGDE